MADSAETTAVVAASESDIAGLSLFGTDGVMNTSMEIAAIESALNISQAFSRGFLGGVVGQNGPFASFQLLLRFTNPSSTSPVGMASFSVTIAVA